MLTKEFFMIVPLKKSREMAIKFYVNKRFNLLHNLFVYFSIYKPSLLCCLQHIVN